MVFSTEDEVEKKALGLHFGSVNTKFISKQFQGLTNNSLILNPIVIFTKKDLLFFKII